MVDELPTKISYEPKMPPNAGRNVLDFERLHVRLWNKPSLTKKERQLLDKLGVWSNIWVARQRGFMWCSTCEDTGIFETWKGKFTCVCPVNGNKPSEIVELSAEGELYERRVSETPRECCICHSTNCNFVTNGRDFCYVCDSEECQRKIWDREEEDE